MNIVTTMHNAYDDGKWIPDRGECDQAFECLTSILARFKLPHGIPERYRHAEPDEFMLMDAIGACTCSVVVYRFKHRTTRNYLHINVTRDGPELMIPKGGSPFRGGTFDE